MTTTADPTGSSHRSPRPGAPPGGIRPPPRPRVAPASVRSLPSERTRPAAVTAATLPPAGESAAHRGAPSVLGAPGRVLRRVIIRPNGPPRPGKDVPTLALSQVRVPASPPDLGPARPAGPRSPHVCVPVCVGASATPTRSSTFHSARRKPASYFSQVWLRIDRRSERRRWFDQPAVSAGASAVPSPLDRGCDHPRSRRWRSARHSRTGHRLGAVRCDGRFRRAAPAGSIGPG